MARVKKEVQTTTTIGDLNDRESFIIRKALATAIDPTANVFAEDEVADAIELRTQIESA